MAFQVRLTLHGEIEDENFVRYLEQATRDAGRSLSVGELRVLDAIRREHLIPAGEASSVRAERVNAFETAGVGIL